MATLPLRAATQSLPFWEGGPLAVEEGSGKHLFAGRPM